MDSSLVQGHIAVDDVAIAQFPVVGDAVANHFIYRGANRLREGVGSARIFERARVGTYREGTLVAGNVDLFGRDAGSNQRAEIGQGVSGFKAR